MKPPGAPSRTTETAFAFAVGFFYVLWAGVAEAAPEVVGPLRLLWQTPAMAGALGGLVGALAHVAAITLAPVAVSRRDVRRAIIEGVFSVIVGAISAHYLTGQAARFVPHIDRADRLSVAFGVGVLAWRAAPGVLAGVRLATQPGELKAMLLRALNATPRSGGGA